MPADPCSHTKPGSYINRMPVSTYINRMPIRYTNLFEGCTSRANTAPLQKVCVEIMGVMTSSLEDRGSVNFPIPTRDFDAPKTSTGRCAHHCTLLL